MSRGTVSGNGIITDGLIFSIDPANNKSYISGSTIWRDISANASTGSLINGPMYSAENGGVLSFDGVDDYGAFDNGGKFNITETTWGAWIYTTKNDNETIISAEGTSTYGYGFRNRTGPNIYWILGYPGAGNACQTSYGSINKWFYATGTASATTLKIYLNGVYKAQTPVTNTPNSTAPLYVAYYIYTFGPNNYFAGKISNVHIYNRVLSDQEILQNYNATKTRFGL